jgi:hypothetical protein
MLKMREIFTALNQQRYSKDGMDLGRPDAERHNQIMAEEEQHKQERAAQIKREIEEAKRKAKGNGPKGTPPGPKGSQPKGPK